MLHFSINSNYKIAGCYLYDLPKRRFRRFAARFNQIHNLKVHAFGKLGAYLMRDLLHDNPNKAFMCSVSRKSPNINPVRSNHSQQQGNLCAQHMSRRHMNGLVVIFHLLSGKSTFAVA